jgi:Tfp pilus assembly protein FimT
MSGCLEKADLALMSPSGRVDRIRSSCRTEEAQTMAEYVVVLAVITPIVILAFASLSEAILSVINAVRGFL